MNPVVAGISKKPEEYEWSSYHFYISKRKKPDWMFCDKILHYFDNNFVRYKEFTLQGTEEEIMQVFESKRQPAILGDAKFVASIKSSYKVESTIMNEVPQYSDLLKSSQPSVLDIVKIISSKYNVSKEQVLSRKSFLCKKYLLRNVAIFLASTRSGQNQKNIARVFRNISYARVSQIFNEIRCKIEIDFILKQEISKIEEDILKFKI